MEYNALEQSLFGEIARLISLHQEGGYWDFKRQWHEKKTDLLHDIICMANNLCNHAAYIIIGVDEENDYAIVDVKADPNRKNTQKIVDFLKDKKFAGGIRPVAHVETFCYHNSEIDVIVIENSQNTPFYLTDRFEGVMSNHIYVRVMDTNTPIDGSADINYVEQLWRKRFRLDELPIDKFCYYLKNPDDWEPIQDHDMGYFYKYAPEYTLICEEDHRNGYEYYIFGQVNTNPSWWMITLKYHQTAIDKYLGVSLDGGRSFVVAPERAYNLCEAGISSIGFYTQDDLRFRLLEFYHAKEASDEYSYRTYMSSIILFESKHEHEHFFNYVMQNIQHYHDLYTQQGNNGLPYFPDLKGYVMDGYRKDYRDALVLQKMLREFRNVIN